MAIQLNPAPVDVPYPYYPTGYTHLMIRGMVMNACGFVDRLSVTSPGWPYAVIGNRTLGDLRSDIITRLGIGTPPSVKTDTLANIQADLFNMLGMAAMVVAPPPGIASMITSFINEAQQMIFNAIEMDQGANSHPPTLVNGTDVTVFDRTAVTTLALGLGKAHYGQEDAQIYMQESAKYLKDFADRQPVNIKNIVNAAIVDAQRNILAQYFTMANPATVLAGGLSGAMNVSPLNNDTSYTSIASQPVFLLALANLKAFYKQPDAQMAMDEFKLYMADMPPNTWNLVGQMVTMAQEKLYRQYNVFRNERWWTWTLNQGQTFYGIANDDDAVIPTPTGVTAAIGVTSPVTTLLNARFGHRVTALQDGRILISGGLNASNFAITSLEIYDPSTGLITSAGNMVTARAYHTATLLNDGTVLITGGSHNNNVDFTNFSRSAEIFTPSTMSSSLLASSMQDNRALHTATKLDSGDVLIVGGASVGSADLYSISTGVFTSAGTGLVPGIMQHTATKLNDGTVLIYGNALGPITAYIYSQSTSSFSPVTVTDSRSRHTATLLKNGLVLISGGIASSAALSSTYLYNPGNKTITASGNLAMARQGHTSVTLPNGNVIEFGGFSDAASSTSLSSSEVYSIMAGTFSAGPAMLGTSGYHQAATLQDGSIAAFGGASSIGATTSTPTNLCEIYYPTSNVWSVPANLTTGTDYYRVAAFDNQGHFTLPSTEISVASVPASTSVVLNWTAVPNGGVAGYAIYGRTHNGEQLLATVDKFTTTWTDLGTIIPNGAMPTVNNTGILDVGQTHPILDQRKVSWAGVSRGDNMWRPLIKGVPPVQYRVPLAGVPAYYDIREAIEIWPPPADSSWLLRIKGEYQLAPFVAPTDTATIDYQAIYLQATADVKAFYKQPDAEHFMLSTREYVGNLVAGQHTTQRYIPTQHSDYIAPTIPVALPPVT